MAPRITYANLPFGPNSFALFDQSFSDCTALGVLPCASTGDNDLVLTPLASSFAFTLTAYTSFYGLYTFTATGSSSSAVTANVGGLGSLNVYLSDGVTQAGNQALLNGGFYAMSYSGALNSGVGGFYLISTGASTTNLSLTGDVTATGTSPLITTIAPNVVTYDKIQQAQATVLLANPTGNIANYSEVTVGPTLAFSNTSLQTAAMTGDVVTPPNSFQTTISTGAVTLAQQANLPPFTVIGNNTNAIASPAALGQTQLTSLVNTFTNGLPGAVPAPLANADTVHFLCADGTWKTTQGALILLSKLDALTGIPTLKDQTNITSTFRQYMFTFENVVPTLDGSVLIMQISTDGGATFKNAGYVSTLDDTGPAGSNAFTFTAGIMICLQTPSTVGLGICGDGLFFNPTGVTNRKMLTGQTCGKFFGGGQPLQVYNYSGFYDVDASAINAIQFLYSAFGGGTAGSPNIDGSGNSIASGVIRIYGVVGP